MFFISRSVTPDSESGAKVNSEKSERTTLQFKSHCKSTSLLLLDPSKAWTPLDPLPG